MRLFWIPLALSLILVGGCAGGGGAAVPLPTADDGTVSERRLRDGLRRLTPSDSLTALALRRAGVTPAFGDRFLLGRGVVAGYLPGQHPARRGELVVIGATRGTPAAVALVEAAHVMAGRAAFGTWPERTLLIALWPSEGEGLDTVLRAPLWERARVHSAWAVGGDPTGIRRVLEPAGLPGGVIGGGAALLDPLAEANRLAQAILTRLDAEARGAADSLSTP